MRVTDPPNGGKRTDPSATTGARCKLPVLDAKRRARVCGAPATTTREITGNTIAACESCATALDTKIASGALPKAHDLSTPEGQARHDADVRARWDAEQAKLPPAKRRTYEQASDDDEAHMGRQLRRGLKLGLL